MPYGRKRYMSHNPKITQPYVSVSDKVVVFPLEMTVQQIVDRIKKINKKVKNDKTK
mgnify:FL=1|jgi:replicative DNA helicase